MSAVVLENRGGSLYLDKETILLVRYPEGDCDTISWPKPDEKNLRAALYDELMMGALPPDCRTVLLPDGVEFEIE